MRVIPPKPQVDFQIKTQSKKNILRMGNKLRIIFEPNFG